MIQMHVNMLCLSFFIMYVLCKKYILRNDNSLFLSQPCLPCIDNFLHLFCELKKGINTVPSSLV